MSRDLVDEVSQEFFELERELNVFNIKPDDVPIWKRIRFNLFEDIRQESVESGQALTRNEYDFASFLKGIQLWFKNMLVKNPFLSDQRDFLFYGHPRRKLEAENKWWDIYCDPVTSGNEIDYLHVERPYLMEHKSPVKTGDLRYIDFIWYTGAVRRNLGLSDVTISGDDRTMLRDVGQAIRTRFDVDIDVVTRAEIKLTRRDSLLDLYKRFLRRVDPTVTIIVVSYGKHTFLEACHDLGIPTVELQHGIIHSNHMGYAFPGTQPQDAFPEYIFTWGQFWNENTEYPLPEDRIINVGFPYLEQRRKKYATVEPKDQILFISQGTVGPTLSKFALETSEHPDIDYDIVYKLHPGEYDRWRDEYPWLVGTDMTVIGSSEPPLYELFAESSVQVGVGSTALFEGLCFDLETYIYEWPGFSIMDSLIEEGAAETISSVDELASSLGTGEIAFNREHYFKSDATENTHQALHKIASTRRS